jgi:CBS domain-containing protein
MLCKEIILPNYPTLHLEDEVGKALSLQVSAVPVLEEQALAGLLPIQEINTLPPETKIESLRNLFIKISVLDDEHFLSAFKTMQRFKSSVVPVIDVENKYCGVSTQESVLNELGVLLDIQNGNSGIIVLEMDKINYAFSELSRLIESCEADILELNTHYDVKAETFVVTVCVNRTNVSDIVSTLQQYNYHVVYYFGNEAYRDDIKNNYEALIHYLNI